MVLTLVQTERGWIVMSDFTTNLFGRAYSFERTLRLTVDYLNQILTLAQSNEATGRNPE
jgi:hypothetical protein